MKSFLGLKEFEPKSVFDLSLLGEIRKRVGYDAFDLIPTELIKSVTGEKDKHDKQKNKKDDSDTERITYFLLWKK